VCDASRTRKFSYVPFTRRVRLRPPLSLSLFSLILGFVSFSLSCQSTHTRRNIARSSKRSFAIRDTRVNIHAPVVVAFRCIFTPESSLPRYIFIRREWYVTGLPPIQRMTGGGDTTREKDWSIRESLDCYLVEVQREIYSQHPLGNSSSRYSMW